MRKLIAVGVVVGGLLAGAGPAMAQFQPQGGIGDPLTLAASGVLIPYITGGGTVALIEVASPVGNNPNAHMLFYNANCARVGDSVGIPLTTNDIAFQDVSKAVPPGTDGLVAIAGVDPTGFTLVPLESPIHSRVYLFTLISGRSRVLEPIVIDTAEFGLGSTGNSQNLWSPLRTGATFYAPLETAIVKTQLTLVCPRSSIQGDSDAAFGSGGPFTSTGFPQISPSFKSSPSTGDMRARIYDTNENFKRDVRFSCDCLTADLSVSSLSSFYGDAPEAANGTYTEIEVTSAEVGSFTGYRNVFTVGSPLNNFSGRLSNGSRASIQGTLSDSR
jgi:hypothetical protein